MAVTIQVNGKNLSLVHQGSAGVVKSTLPDVCKTPTPGGPVPIPYPVIVSLTSDLKKGSKTVLVDGGNPAAVKGSQLSRCTGDEPGTLGGVKSGTNMKEATWLTYSFDVIIEGRNACRLSDKLLMNHGNTACLGGIIQAPIDATVEIAIICEIICFCDKNPTLSSSGKSELKEECVKNTLLLGNEALGMSGDNTLQNQARLKPEIPYNMTTSPPTPLLHRAGDGNLRPTEHLVTRMIQEGLKSASRNRGIYQVRRPDVIIVKDLSKPLVADNLKAVVEIKFNDQPRDPLQIQDYELIAGDKSKVVELDPEKCGCDDGESDPEFEPAPEPVLEPTPIEVPSPDSVFDWEYWEEVTGLTGFALVLYLIISEGSRLYPPRNLVPIP